MTEKERIEMLEEEDESSMFGFLNLQTIYKILLFNWYWFVLSIVICVGIVLVDIRYTQPVYQVSSKMLIRSAQTGSTRISSAVNLGHVNNSDGFDNEMVLLKSVQLAEDAVKDLKLYVSYMLEGTVTDKPMYGNNPVSVDLDEKHLDDLSGSIAVDIEQVEHSKISVSCNVGGKIYKRTGNLPMSISTPQGVLSFKSNPQGAWNPGKKIMATISNPKAVAGGYAGNLSTGQLSETTSIAVLSRTDILPQRSIDYLKQLVVVYNRQANEDKNQVAFRTEQFINQRLEKINVELGSTDSKIENYKQSRKMVGGNSIAGAAMEKYLSGDDNLDAMETELMLQKSIMEYMNMPANKYQTLPSNVGLTDPAATSLIAQYNELVMKRNQLLHNASEINPSVKEITHQIDDLSSSIKRAMHQYETSLQLKRNAIQRLNGKYTGQISEAPEQERYLTEIGREQSVKSSLYILLLQKREENSISLAATADKGRLIDDPVCVGQISPEKNKLMGIAFGVGFGFPFLIFLLIEFFRFRIEGHEDVAKLTDLPIIADIAVANDAVKTRGDIVVRANKNSQMEEVFRGMRTNLQFMMKENENVIMFTSSTSGEGKTFTAANLAVSFALLGKKVLIVGLDIRRPRLSTLFEVKTKSKGISTLLTYDNPTREEIMEVIQESEIDDNLWMMPAGPVPPNPSELVSRKSLEDIFAILRKEFDYVVVDTAPVGLVTDTLQIARVCDATVLMCRADYTEKAAFANINSLAHSNILPNVAIAINGIDMSKKKYGYAYGYGRYGKYGKYSYRNYYGKSKYGGYGYGGYGYGGYGYGGRYSTYGYHSYGYGSYSNSHYGNPDDNSIKK